MVAQGQQRQRQGQQIAAAAAAEAVAWLVFPAAWLDLAALESQ
jgi:hypothetical protein